MRNIGDEMNEPFKYDVKVFNTKDLTDYWITHTYASSQPEAYARLEEMMAASPEIWGEWDFEIL